MQQKQQKPANSSPAKTTTSAEGVGGDSDGDGVALFEPFGDITILAIDGAACATATASASDEGRSVQQQQQAGATALAAITTTAAPAAAAMSPSASPTLSPALKEDGVAASPELVAPASPIHGGHANTIATTTKSSTKSNSNGNTKGAHHSRVVKKRNTISAAATRMDPIDSTSQPLTRSPPASTAAKDSDSRSTATESDGTTAASPAYSTPTKPKQSATEPDVAFLASRSAALPHRRATEAASATSGTAGLTAGTTGTVVTASRTPMRLHHQNPNQNDTERQSAPEGNRNSSSSSNKQNGAAPRRASFKSPTEQRKASFKSPETPRRASFKISGAELRRSSFKAKSDTPQKSPRVPAMNTTSADIAHAGNASATPAMIPTAPTVPCAPSAPKPVAAAAGAGPGPGTTGGNFRSGRYSAAKKPQN